MKKFFCVILFANVLSFAYSQEKTNNSVFLELGLKHLASSNRYLSYLNVEGVVTSTYFGYQRKSKESLFGLSVNFVTGETTSDYVYFSPSFIDLNLNIDYSRRINPLSKKYICYVGMGVVSGTWMFLDNFEGLVDMISLLPSHNLELFGNFEYQLNQKSWVLYTLRLGVLSLVSTQPYSSYDEDWIKRAENNSLFFSGEWLSIGQNFRMKHSFCFERELNPKYTLGANITAEVLSLNSHRKVAFVAQTISLTISRKF